MKDNRIEKIKQHYTIILNNKRYKVLKHKIDSEKSLLTIKTKIFGQNFPDGENISFATAEDSDSTLIVVLPILCGIFFVESLSVMIQVWYFKLGKRRGVKQRVFRRTPIHDTFRTQDCQLDPECKYLLKGPKTVAHESKITIRFWIVTIILAALTIITLKMR